MNKREKAIKISKIIWIVMIPLFSGLTVAAITASAMKGAASPGDSFDVAGQAILDWTLPFALAFFGVFLLALIAYLSLRVKKDSIDHINYSLRKFWDGVFKEAEGEKITAESLSFLDSLNPFLLEVNKAGKRIIDVGCGGGEMLMQMAFLDKEKTHYYLGLDQSSQALRVASETAKLSGLDNLGFVQGGLQTLEKLPSASFDGGMTSNFLDVIPEETAKDFIAQLARIIKSDGLLMVKLNFVVDEAHRKQVKGIVDQNGNIYINGILRTTNKPTDYWESLFSDSFLLVSKSGYQRVSGQPEDRVFLLKRK